MMIDSQNHLTMASTETELENQLFREAMKQVKPLKAQEKIPLGPSKTTKPLKSRRLIADMAKAPEPIPSILSIPEESLLKNVLPLAPEAYLYFARHGIHPRTLRQFKRGQLKLTFKIDLHGQTQKESSIHLQKVLPVIQQQKHRVGLIVHGKGKNEISILKSFLNVFLKECSCILAFATACSQHGGAGALYILLKMHSDLKHTI